jgi:serine/threonine protein kinase
MEGIDYMHKVGGVCHRDIKPQNILVTDSLRVYIADFNVARKKQQESAAFRMMTKTGTLAFSAPEIFLQAVYE